MQRQHLEKRSFNIDLNPEEFKHIGYKLVDQISELLEGISEYPVTPGETPEEVQHMLNSDSALPENGYDPVKVIERSTKLLIDHSLYNGHPKFWGYITSSAAPLGILGDFLARAGKPTR